MISASVRQSLNVVGRSVSIRELVRLRNQNPPWPIRLNSWTFPLSLRKFVGALPPGRMARKVISLDLLQRKFNEFFNERSRPLFKFRLHGTHYGSSKLEIFFEDPVEGLKPFGEPVDLGHLEIDAPGPFNPDYHFNDLNSDRITVNVIQGQPAGIEVRISFETQGEEIKINNFPNVDLKGLYIRLKMEFGSWGGAMDLVGWIDEVEAAVEKAEVRSSSQYSTLLRVKFRDKVFEAAGYGVDGAKKALRQKLLKEFISADVNVDASGLPDGSVARAIEDKVTEKGSVGLQDSERRTKINRRLTPWLVGGDFHVVTVANDSRAVTIDYILPLGQLEPFPEVPQPPLDRGLLANIDHIVVLMMENRSFDHMLGYLRKDGTRLDIDGLKGGEKNTYMGKDYPSFPLPGTVFNPGPCHERECVKDQVNDGALDGFVANYAPRAEAKNISPGEIMGYYRAGQVPVYDALARHFLICQRWFAAHPGPTFPNRFYTLTGRLNRDSLGEWQNNNPEGSSFLPIFTKTIFDHLTAQGVTWRYYEHGYCSLRLFERYTYDTEHILEAGIDAKNFVADARAGSLQSVTFIDPDFINVPPGNDDQPPADIKYGQRLIGRVVDALINGPLWNKTLLVITYDEHGGFFDHVPPPSAPPVSGIDRYGVRLPAFVISPWVEAGKVTNVVFDHTSIIKTIARRFLNARPPDMGERVAAANDLSAVLQTTARTDKPSIPVPTAPAPNAALARQSEVDTEGPGVLLRSLRVRYPIRRAIKGPT
jgi:phospholipase C